MVCQFPEKNQNTEKTAKMIRILAVFVIILVENNCKSNKMWW